MSKSLSKATLSNGDCIPSMNFKLSKNAKHHIAKVFLRMHKEGLKQLTLKPCKNH
jgi:hypothetical protein